MDLMQETSYGIVKRFQFVESTVREVVRCQGRVKIADVGCGTGLLLTLPLAQSLDKQALIYAHDSDRASLSYLCEKTRELRLGNVIPVEDIACLKDLSLDVVIASEVIEHVDEPYKFLKLLCSMLNPTGKLILTLPNGYGWFEIDTMLYNTLQMVGVLSLLRRLKKLLVRRPPQGRTGDTLAFSPHINFFTLNQIRLLLADAGMRLEKIDGRTFACGSLVDRFVGCRSRMLALNDYLGSSLPLVLVSGWMIVATPDSVRPGVEKHRPLSPFQRLYVGYKRFINLHSGLGRT
jgi:SAM-dependent methyltransferase